MPAYITGDIKSVKDTEDLLLQVNKSISLYIHNLILDKEMLEDDLKEKETLSYQEGYDDGCEATKENYN